MPILDIRWPRHGEAAKSLPGGVFTILGGAIILNITYSEFLTTTIVPGPSTPLMLIVITVNQENLILQTPPARVFPVGFTMAPVPPQTRGATMP